MTFNWKKINIKTVLVAAACIYGAYYFLAGDGSIKMNSTKAIELVLKQVEKVDTDKYQILEVEWYEGEKLSNSPGSVSLTLLDKEGDRYSQHFDIFEDKELSFKKIENHMAKFSTYKTPDYKPLNISEDIKADQIVSQMESAIKQLPEDAIFQSVYEYNIEKDNDTGELKRRIVLRVTKKGEEKEVSGRRVTTNYYEIPFDIALDGTATTNIEE